MRALNRLLIALILGTAFVLGCYCLAMADTWKLQRMYDLQRAAYSELKSEVSSMGL